MRITADERTMSSPQSSALSGETRDRRLRTAAIVFAVIGLLVASYLVYIKVSNTNAFCGGVGDCEAVNSSPYSQIGGIPIALFGWLAYLAILGCLLLETRVNFLKEYGVMVVFGMALAGTLYSAYLTYLELFVIHKICPYCVASAVMMTAICIVSAFRLQKAFQKF